MDLLDFRFSDFQLRLFVDPKSVELWESAIQGGSEKTHPLKSQCKKNIECLFIIYGQQQMFLTFIGNDPTNNHST